jgi:branched-chain amino acid transport system substrate-binding protein
MRRAALLYDDENAAPAVAAPIFQSAAEDSGITLVATETFASGTTNFA